MTKRSQRQDISGAGAIAAQVFGDHNKVEINVGSACLALTKLHARKSDPQTVIELLRVDVRATTLVGRADDLDMLARWCDGAEAIAVKCVTGRAGAGKTRLAVEACEAAEAQGWAAGFVTSDELRRFHETQNLVHWRLNHDTIIVLDYAAASLPILKAWFELLAPSRHVPTDYKLRILLLERHADTELGWWADLTRRESLSHAGATDLIGEEGLYALASLAEVEDRRVLLAEAIRLAAPLLDPPVTTAPAPPPAGTDAWFDARLADPRIENEPLYLLMIGVHAARHGTSAALAFGRDKLAFAMAEIERVRLERFALRRGFNDHGALLCHLVACVTLQNGCRLDSISSLVREESEEMGLDASLGPEPIALALVDCLPDAPNQVDAIRPDLIGEAFLLAVVAGGRLRSADARRAIVLRAHRRDPVGVVQALVRCACDYADGHANHEAVEWLSAIARASEDFGELMRLSASLPKQTLALRELAAATDARIVEVLRAASIDAPELRPGLASSLNDLATRLGELGQREEALKAAHEATDIYRLLADAQPDAFTPDLAVSLNNLANRLSELGQREDALTAAREAVALRRMFTAARSDALTPDLAMALSNLAVHLSELGQREEALTAAREAVALRRVLAGAQPDIFTPDLASSLNNVANHLSELGQREEALTVAREAVGMYRVLSAARPDAFIPELAVSLNNLANRLSELGQREEALTAAREAVTLRRVLAAARPDAFTPNLAVSLNNLAAHLSELGQREEAFAAAREALDLYRVLAAARPDAFLPNLAGSLNNLANHLSEVGQREEALTAAREGADIYRVLAAVRPDAFTPDLAMALSNLANHLSELGQREEALTAAREAVALLHALVAARPDTFTPDLAMALSNLTNHLSELGQREEALTAAREAVALYRVLAASRPDAFTPNLAGALNNFASRLNQLGQREEALTSAREAVALRRVLAAAQPDAFKPDLATSLSVLGDMLEANGHLAEAVVHDHESVMTLQPYFLAHPRVYKRMMIVLARDYLRRVKAAGIEPDVDLLDPIATQLAVLADG